jgi:predicted mannosyl-3-phosphoglycerate phosphatase (HAD superfamily)
MKFIIDLDGTLLSNDFPNLDSAEFMAEITKREMDVMIMTNSVCHPDIIVNRQRGVPVISASGSSYYLKGEYKEKDEKRCDPDFVVGGLMEIFELIDNKEF